MSWILCNINPCCHLTIINNNSNVHRILWQFLGLENVDPLDCSEADRNQDQERPTRLAVSFPPRSSQLERDRIRDGCQWKWSATRRHQLMKRSSEVTHAVAEMQRRAAGYRSRRNRRRCLPSETAANHEQSNQIQSDIQWRPPQYHITVPASSP